MARYSAIVTCFTECTVQVEADSADEARHAIEQGQFSFVELHDGGLSMAERFIDVDIVEESFGEDSVAA